MSKLFIIGAGGHGKVVAEAAILAGYELAAFIDDGKKKGDKVIGNYAVAGPISEAKSILGKNDFFVVAIGNNEVRKRLFEEVGKIAKAATIIHPSAVVSSSAIIGEGTVILANSVINAQSKIGKNCIVNSLTLVDHESETGNHVHISQGSIIGSLCKLPDLYTTELGQKIKSGIKM